MYFRRYVYNIEVHPSVHCVINSVELPAERFGAIGYDTIRECIVMYLDKVYFFL